MKKITVLILLSMMLTGLIGCSNEHSEQEKEKAKKNVMGDGKQPYGKDLGL